MADAAVQIQALPLVLREVLRMRIALRPLDIPINTCTNLDGATVARLGPDEWLVLEKKLELPAQTETFVSRVDISHRHVAFEVKGQQARDVLNTACPLDLHHEAFPPGSATRTILGKAEIVLLHQGGALAYRVECGRSFAPYVSDLLREAAKDYSLE